ncbi:MAG: hypothetical protein IPJ94_09485 [Chloroflexi bacterium]|nr:hypothetical protein [Chloroflexota bacterium]
MYSLADIDDATAVPVDPFIGMHDAWRVGDWIINPWAIIHADYARIASDYEHTLPNTDRVILFVESVQAAPAEPVAIRVDTNGRYSVVMRHADFAERELSVTFWLPAWEMGLDGARCRMICQTSPTCRGTRTCCWTATAWLAWRWG